MAGKRKKIVDIYALLQHLRAGHSNRRVKRELGIDRRTVQKYREWAEEYNLLSGSLPPSEELYQLLEETMPPQQPPQSQSTVEPYRKQVVKLREQGVEISAIKARLEERGFEGSYMAVYRFIRQMEPIRLDVTVRVETAPGEEVQVDFGYGGRMIDPATGEIRKTWAFVMTLSWSRHQYVEFLRCIYERGVGMTIGSDCHEPVYGNYQEAAAAMLSAVGFKPADFSMPRFYRLPGA